MAPASPGARHPEVEETTETDHHRDAHEAQYAIETAPGLAALDPAAP